MRKLVGAMVAVGLLTAACGSGSSSQGGASGASTGTSGQPDSYVADVKGQVDQLLGKGSFQPPPTSAPAHEAGKVIAIIDTEAFTPQKQTIAAEQEAAAALGWTTILLDTQGDNTGAGKLILSAIAQKVDAITLDVIDCRYVQPQLQAAKDAGIPVIAVEGYDCSDTSPGAPSLYTDTVKYPMGTQQDYYKALYTAMAQYPIAKLDGKSDAIYMVDNAYQASISSVDTVKAAYAPCSTCSLVVDEFPLDQFGNLKARAQTLLLRNPNTNTVIPSYGDITTAGVADAVAQTGKDIVLNAGDSATSAGIKLVLSGKATYGYGFTAGWKGYALIDTVLRNFAGEKSVSCGMGVNLYDATHNLDAAGEYIQPYDYAALYKKAWSVG
jgi:ribose transport system substrate-binding protein